MNVKLSQRSVRAGDVLTLLGVTAANVPREKSLTRTHRNALVSFNIFLLLEILLCKTRKQSRVSVVKGFLLPMPCLETIFQVSEV